VKFPHPITQDSVKWRVSSEGGASTRLTVTATVFRVSRSAQPPARRLVGDRQSDLQALRNGEWRTLANDPAQFNNSTMSPRAADPACLQTPREPARVC